MAQELEEQKLESEQKINSLESELLAAKYKKDRLNKLTDKRNDEMKALTSEKLLLKDELARQREEKEKYLIDAQSSTSLCESVMHNLDNMR